MNTQSKGLHRRSADMTGEVLAMRLEHIEETLKRLDNHMAAINGAMIGTVKEPGFVAKIAAHGEAIETHKRNFRLIAFTFVTQTVALLTWALVQVYTLISR